MKTTLSNCWSFVILLTALSWSKCGLADNEFTYDEVKEVIGPIRAIETLRDAEKRLNNWLEKKSSTDQGGTQSELVTPEELKKEYMEYAKKNDQMSLNACKKFGDPERVKQCFVSYDKTKEDHRPPGVERYQSVNLENERQILLNEKTMRWRDPTARANDKASRVQEIENEITACKKDPILIGLGTTDSCDSASQADRRKVESEYGTDNQISEYKRKKEACNSLLLTDRVRWENCLKGVWEEGDKFTKTSPVTPSAKSLEERKIPCRRFVRNEPMKFMQCIKDAEAGIDNELTRPENIESPFEKLTREANQISARCTDKVGKNLEAFQKCLLDGLTGEAGSNQRPLVGNNIWASMQKDYTAQQQGQNQTVDREIIRNAQVRREAEEAARKAREEWERKEKEREQFARQQILARSNTTTYVTQDLSESDDDDEDTDSLESAIGVFGSVLQAVLPIVAASRGIAVPRMPTSRTNTSAPRPNRYSDPVKPINSGSPNMKGCYYDDRGQLACTTR